MNNRAPLIVAIVLLLLPVLYVGSYLALVQPQSWSGYRIRDVWPAFVFYPIEKIDRKLRPKAWEYDDSPSATRAPIAGAGQAASLNRPVPPSGLLDDRRSLQIEKSLGASP